MNQRKKGEQGSVVQVPKLLYRRHEAAYARGLSIQKLKLMMLRFDGDACAYSKL